MALTTDEWTSRATKSYNTMTATIINDNWKLREFVLCTKELPESHTVVNLASDFKHQTDQWGLDLSRCMITTENAANIVSAIESCNVDCHVRCLVGLGALLASLKEVRLRATPYGRQYSNWSFLS